MSYQSITGYNSPNYTPYAQVSRVFGYPRNIVGVVYHWWGDPGAGSTFQGVISWLCRAGGNTSAHTVGESGRIARIIADVNAAWHSGNARGNAQYVGYECNPRLGDGEYEAMGKWHYDMEKAHNKTLEIRTHNEFTSTQCSPINKTRIRQIADRHHNPPKPNPTLPVPAVKRLEKPVEFRMIIDASVWDLTTNPNYKAVAKLPKGHVEQMHGYVDFNNTRYYMTKYSTDGGFKNGVNKNDMVEVVPEPVIPEWERRLVWKGEGKLSVLPSEGVKVLDLATGNPANGDIIPRGTQIDVVGHTFIGSNKYYISSWAKKNLKMWGIPAEKLGVPVVEPPREKPEWLENLVDIEDQDFWTRSETPVLRLEDGVEVERLPVNRQVRVTHTTEIVGLPLMVLEGKEQAVEPIYLSDTPMKDPDSDLEERVSRIEKIIQTIIAFFTDLVRKISKGE